MDDCYDEPEPRPERLEDELDAYIAAVCRERDALREQVERLREQVEDLVRAEKAEAEVERLRAALADQPATEHWLSAIAETLIVSPVAGRFPDAVTRILNRVEADARRRAKEAGEARPA